MNLYKLGVRYYCSSTAESRTQGLSGLVVERRTPEREVTGLNPTTAMQWPEQDTLSSQKYW